MPLTLAAAQKAADLLTTADALNNALKSAIAADSVMEVLPTVPAANVVVSSASTDLADRNLQLSYPRIAVSCTALKNTNREKYRSISGSLTINIEVLASDQRIDDVDRAAHYYATAVVQVLQNNRGRWGGGLFFGGAYGLHFGVPKAGGFGFVQTADISFDLNVSVS